MRSLLLRATALCVVGSLAFSHAAPTLAQAQTTTPPAPVTAASAAAQAVSLQPGDLVRVQIWREEDLSGEFLVDEQGVVTLPLLGEKRVTGLGMRELRTMLVDGYRVHLRNPSINVTPLRRINVLGEVNKPGLYAVDPTISLAGVVALAGGATQAGDLRRIRVVRSGQVVVDRVPVGQTLTTIDVRSGDEVLVERRGWFERNSSLVVTALISVTGIVISILTRPK